MTETTTPTQLTDETPSYVKTLSILAGIREVRDELAKEATAILNANPDKAFPRGYGERVALIEALDDGYKTMIADVRRTSRSSGLSMPSDLC